MSPKKIRAIITGATGMVGEGVLHECLLNPQVESILLVNRKPSGIKHPKVEEVIHNDFFSLWPIEGILYGYNACFFCLGVSAVGMKDRDYYKYTYSLTMAFARVLAKLNDDMTFCYVSGAGTDSTEHGSSTWARIKGKTENDLMKLPFEAVYNFRPGYMHPTKGLKKTTKQYKYIKWVYPIAKSIVPGLVCTLAELGQAMINAKLEGYPTSVLEIKDIVSLAHVGELA
jgi:uncharacterized protein YbjT (DUF2867 family)